MEIEDPTPVKKRPNGHLRQRWLSREELDGRTRAAKMFEQVEVSVIEDLGGDDNISAVQRHLISAFAGMAVVLRRSKRPYHARRAGRFERFCDMQQHIHPNCKPHWRQKGTS